MAVALYHPRGGYYTGASPVGASGDYFTSPAVHPAFGALVAVQLHRMWELIERPPLFLAVEMGAGAGLLTRDVMACAAAFPDAFSSCLQYIEMERSAVGSAATEDPRGPQRVVASGLPFGRLVGCLVSNELVDSFPVHRFMIEDGAAVEVYVTLDDDGHFVEVAGEPSTPHLAGRIRDLGFPLAGGFRGEVNLEIGPWLEEVSAALERGFVLTIDYGHEADELYAASRSAGTLQTHYRHVHGGSPYQRIGRQDITAHVDFSLLASEGRKRGLTPLPLMTQAQFLRVLGFDAMLERLRAAKLAHTERSANRIAMLELVKPEGLGGFKVLIQERNTGVDDLRPLAPAGPSSATEHLPLLRPDNIPLMQGRYPHLSWETEELWPFDQTQP